MTRKDPVRIADFLERREFAVGDVIFREGDTGRNAFIVEFGRVEISGNLDGEKVVINSLGKNCLIGELALVDQSPRSATVIAMEPTICTVISGKKFQTKLEEADPFIDTLLGIFVNTIRSLTDRMIMEKNKPHNQ